MDAAGTLPFLRGQKSAKNSLDTARLLKMSIENTKLLHTSEKIRYFFTADNNTYICFRCNEFTARNKIKGCTVDSKTLYRLHSIKHGVEFWSGVIGWSIDIYGIESWSLLSC